MSAFNITGYTQLQVMAQFQASVEKNDELGRLLAQ
jgi:hypothetical protein